MSYHLPLWVVLLFLSNLPFHEAPLLSKVLGFVGYLSSSSPPGGDFVSFPQRDSRSLGRRNSISIVTDSVFAFLTGFLLPFWLVVFLFVCLSPRIFPFLSCFPSKWDMCLKVLHFIGYIAGCRNAPIHSNHTLALPGSKNALWKFCPGCFPAKSQGLFLGVAYWKALLSWLTSLCYCLCDFRVFLLVLCNHPLSVLFNGSFLLLLLWYKHASWTDSLLLSQCPGLQTL